MAIMAVGVTAKTLSPFLLGTATQPVKLPNAGNRAPFFPKKKQGTFTP